MWSDSTIHKVWSLIARLLVLAQTLCFKFPRRMFSFCVYKYLRLHICFPSRTFSPTKPAKSLHTQKNRQFFHEPEENFWMVMVRMHVIRISLKHHIAAFSMHSALSNSSLFHFPGCTESHNRKTQRWKASLWISGRRITGNKISWFDSSWIVAKLTISLYLHKWKKGKALFNKA